MVGIVGLDADPNEAIMGFANSFLVYVQSERGSDYLRTASMILCATLLQELCRIVEVLWPVFVRKKLIGF